MSKSCFPAGDLELVEAGFLNAATRAQEGDVIVVSFGAKVPYLLQPIDEGGDDYIHARVHGWSGFDTYCERYSGR